MNLTEEDVKRIERIVEERLTFYFWLGVLFLLVTWGGTVLLIVKFGH